MGTDNRICDSSWWSEFRILIMSIEQIKIILGDEYDDEIREVLRVVLVSNGAIEIDKSWGVGGSQEIEITHIRLGDDLIVVEAETFIGLSITGPKSRIENLAQQVEDFLQKK